MNINISGIICGAANCFCPNDDSETQLLVESQNVNSSLQDLSEVTLIKGPMDPAVKFDGNEATNLLMEQAYHEIVPGLFLGGKYIPQVVKGQQNGKFNNIDMPDFNFIVSATVRPLDWAVPHFSDRYTFPIVDGNTDVSIESFIVDNQKNMKEAVQKIHTAITNGSKVFVHCQQGVDRSTTVVLAYLMSAHSLSFDAALAHTRSWRHIAEPMPIYTEFLKDTFVKVEL